MSYPPNPQYPGERRPDPRVLYSPETGQPYTPPPPRRRKRWPWIVGGIALLCVLGCVGFLTLVVGGTAKVATDLDKNQKGTNATAGQMNKPTTDGKFQFTVTAMHCGIHHLGDKDFGETAQGSYCLVNVTVKNVGTTAETFSSFDQKGAGPAGAQYDSDTAAETDANSQNQTFLQDINPGNTVRGTLVFDVPKGTALAAITLHESTFTPGIKVPLHAS